MENLLASRLSGRSFAASVEGVAVKKLLVLALLALLGSPLTAQTSPPNGAHLLGSSGPLTLRWPGREGEVFLVQILAGRASVVEEMVRETVLRVELKPGPLYTWQVSRRNARGQFDLVVPPRKFQFSDQLLFRFDGAPGRPGQRPGQSGQAGSPGSNVTVRLNPADDFIAVEIEDLRTNRKFFLLPGSEPVQISARGGRGGAGRVLRAGAELRLPAGLHEGGADSRRRGMEAG